MTETLGELCAGYGGLGMAVEKVFRARTAWYSEYEAAPSKILSFRWPGIPNHGDMTKINWATVDPVTVLSGGTPCQDLSHAGARKGMTEGTRSNLWVQMREAIAILRPKWVVWENVRGAYSAGADSEVEQCPGCMGEAGDGEHLLRALGRVLGDLSDLGYDCQWRGIRAGAETNDGYGSTHVGSCHARFRVFVLAHDTGRVGGPEAIEHDGRGTEADDGAGISHQSDRHALRIGSFREAAATSPDAGGDGWVGWPNSEGEGWRAGIRRETLSDAGDGNTPRPEAPTHADSGDDDGWLAGAEWESVKRIAAAWSSETNWGEYEPAIRRWEFVTGRPAPRPTEPTGRGGGERLSPRFTEWMMGLPDGWVTDPAIGISRNEQLKACGNGVVPQQAMAALQDMLNAFQNEGMTT